MSTSPRPLINEALRLLRLYLGLSQSKMADAVGLSQSTISEIENGAKAVTMDTLERYSAACDVRMSQLLFFAEEMEGKSVSKRGRLIVAPAVLNLLEKLAPKSLEDA